MTLHTIPPVILESGSGTGLWQPSRAFRTNSLSSRGLGEPHHLPNPGKLPLEIIEVQSGSYFGGR